jgi:hypothetical protein
MVLIGIIEPQSREPQGLRKELSENEKPGGIKVIKSRPNYSSSQQLIM